MCGIVGYVGNEQAAPILLEGLGRLEYRGYDSAGVAVYSPKAEALEVYKAKGRLQVLSDMLRGGAAAEFDRTISYLTIIAKAYRIYLL